MNEVFVVLWKDRHVDLAIEVFRDVTIASARAKEITAQYPYATVDPAYGYTPPHWLYRATLSPEGEYVLLQRVTVQ